MKKPEEKKLRAKIRLLIGENYDDSDEVLINDLCDWIKLQAYTKKQIEADVKAGDKLGWTELGTLAMATKNILSILKALGVSVYERTKKMKGKKEEPATNGFDLQKFLKG